MSNAPVVGIDLGGTNMQVGVVAPDGSVVGRAKRKTKADKPKDELIARIAETVNRACDDAGVSLADIAGVGIGAPGAIQPNTGVVVEAPNLRWRNVNLASELGAALNGAAVVVENDVNAAIWGENRAGAGENATDLLGVWVGTGVGGGLALQGKLWLGPLGAAGELGHQTIRPDGPHCGCGNRGCLEAIASGTAIAAEGVRLMKSGLAPALHERVEGSADRVTVREMAAIADQDLRIKESLVDAGKAIGIAAANVVTILHPDLVVLGGGVAEIGPLLVDTVRQVIRDRVGMFPTDNVRVERSLLGDQAGLKGALALAVEPVELSGSDAVMTTREKRHR